MGSDRETLEPVHGVAYGPSVVQIPLTAKKCTASTDVISNGEELTKDSLNSFALVGQRIMKGKLVPMSEAPTAGRSSISTSTGSSRCGRLSQRSCRHEGRT